MANTLKFGSGNWATKEGSTLAYNDENGNFKPLPFDFSRDSSATVVNKYGLIEVVGNDIPRIDYKDDAKGALLLEPTRSNYSASSELPSTWTYTEFGSGSAGTITTGKTDMFGGTNAVQVDFPSDAENVSILFGSSSSGLTSGDTSVSIYIKLVESGSKDVQLRCNFTSIVNVNSTEFTRVYLSGTKTSSEAFNLKLRPSAGTSSGGFSIIVCHPQEENGSYATSYIPTQGGAVTRLADECNGAGNADTFNDSEGVLYAEISALADDGTNRWINLGNGTSSELGVNLRYVPTSNLIVAAFYNGTSFSCLMSTELNSLTQFNKIAFKYKENDFALWVNGIELDTDVSGATNAPLSQLSFDGGTGANDFYGNTKQIQYFNKALTDAELKTLTS